MQLKTALKDLNSAASMFRAGSRADLSSIPAVLVHLAQVAFALGDRERALLSIQEAYDTDLILYGQDHPETLKDLEIVQTLKFFSQIIPLDVKFHD
jgi:hypothetical protein